MTCDTSMLHGRGVSFALAEAELVWREILRGRGRRGVAAGLWRGGAVAAGAGGAGRRAARPEGPGPVRHPDARAVPGPRVPVHVQLLLGDQDRRAADPQPGHRHHPGQPPRRQGGRRPVDHVHLRQLQQVSRGRGAPRGHGRGTARAERSSCSATRRSRGRSDWWHCWPGPGCFQMFVGVESFNRQTLLAAQKGQNRPEVVPRHRATVPRTRDQLALLQHHRLSRRTRSGMSTSTWRRCASWARRGLPSISSARSPAPSSTTSSWPQGLITENEPRPVRHDVPDVAPPPLLARAVGRVAVPVLSQVLLVGPRGAQL